MILTVAIFHLQKWRVLSHSYMCL